VVLTTLTQSMSQLSRQCVVLNISQPYRPPRPVNVDNFTFTLPGMCMGVCVCVGFEGETEVTRIEIRVKMTADENRKL
jgi:hypothetical protein